MKSSQASLILAVIAIQFIAGTGCRYSEFEFPTGPVEDRAQDLCVITKNYDGIKYPYVCDEVCGDYDTKSQVDRCAKADLAALNQSLSLGLEGTLHQVKGSSYQSLSRSTCSNSDLSNSYSFVSRAQIWAKFSCSGIAVNVRVEGPFPFFSLDAKENEIRNELTSQGFTITYVSRDSTGLGSNLYYLSFYHYKSTGTQTQAQAVAALEEMAEFNRKTFSPYRSIRTTVSVASRLHPELKSRSDLAALKPLLNALEELKKKR